MTEQLRMSTFLMDTSQRSFTKSVTDTEFRSEDQLCQKYSKVPGTALFKP